MQTEYYIENASLGFDDVGRILRRRKAWIALGTIVGLLVALGLILFMPKQYTATAHVHVTAPGSTAASGGSGDTIDMATERQLAESANTAEAAAAVLGETWTREELLEGTEVGGDSESTILRVSFTGSSPERAVTGATGMAEAYLKVGSDAATERNEEIVRSLDDQISQHEDTLEGLENSNPEPSTAEEIQVESLRQFIADLQQRKIEMSSGVGTTGEIVTAAEANPVYPSPSTLRTLVLGLIGGLAFGVVLALIMQAVARRPADSSEMGQLLGVPVFRPAAPEGNSDRWRLATEFARHAAGIGGRTALLIDEKDPASIEAADYMAHALGADINGMQDNWTESIQVAAIADSVVVILPLEWSKAALQRLKSDLSQVDAHVVGAVVSNAPADETLE